jgi:hypothetical protein
MNWKTKLHCKWILFDLWLTIIFVDILLFINDNFPTLVKLITTCKTAINNRNNGKEF